MFGIIINELLVDFVRQDENFLFEGHFGQSGEFVFGVDRAGRIAGRVDDDHFGHGAHVLAEKFGG